MIKYEVSGIANKIGLIEVETTSLRKAIKVHKLSRNWATFTISIEDDVILYHEELCDIKINWLEEYEKSYKDNVKLFKKYVSKLDAEKFSNELAKIHVLCV